MLCRGMAVAREAPWLPLNLTGSRDWEESVWQKVRDRWFPSECWSGKLGSDLSVMKTGNSSEASAVYRTQLCDHWGVAEPWTLTENILPLDVQQHWKPPGDTSKGVHTAKDPSWIFWIVLGQNTENQTPSVLICYVAGRNKTSGPLKILKWDEYDLRSINHVIIYFVKLSSHVEAEEFIIGPFLFTAHSTHTVHSYVLVTATHNRDVWCFRLIVLSWPWKDKLLLKYPGRVFDALTS